MGNSQAALLDRTAMLVSKDDGERTKTLDRLWETLDPSDPQAYKTNSQAVLDNKAVMDVLLNLSSTTSSADVAGDALRVLLRLAWDSHSAKRLFQEQPSLVPMVMRKLEFGAEKATEAVLINALCVLRNLAVNDDDNKREMVTKNPTLIPLVAAKVESNSEQVKVEALCVLRSLAFDDNNAREMATLVPLLVATLESNSKQAQERVLEVLINLAFSDDNACEMVAKNPTLVPLLVAKMESNSEQVQIRALGVLRSLAFNNENQREMFTLNPMLVPLLVARVESNSEQVQTKALEVLSHLACNIDNAAEMMATYSAVLIPSLVTKMNGNTRLQAARVVYHLSCSPANRAILHGNSSVVAALTKGREDENASFFSLLALVNLFGAEEDSEVLKTDLAMLQLIFKLIARAMNKDEWDLNKPLLAFRYLCAVEHNRQLLWGEYRSEFLTSVLAALQQAIDDKDTPAVENTMSTLAQFSNDTEPLAWMCSNKPRLDEVIVQLASFPEALKTAQFLLLAMDPPMVVVAPTPVA
ncbi:hypothetical protein BASA81_004826 [Batrachochytrium salamandrivorans]|nr:hypothetical protein BASA81_004826 [Batrachochytrium salamandrivorans]